MTLSAYDKWKLQTPEEAGYYRDEEEENTHREKDDELTEG